jgi:pimeloyl-ACP methyl ester carboxylesterase
VDDWMSPPEAYATELADALEHRRNFFAENPRALFPLVFTARLPHGRTVQANYWLTLPAGFPQEGRRFPLVIALHGTGWLGHKISFVRQARKNPTGSRAFTVTPIDEAGPWQIDFLNAYLDELLRILPADPDRVYLEGHSLGAMATWEWALNNPERFAAISPRAGRGEPYRALRLVNVPAWVIHGARDNVVLTGFSDQMVTALEAFGGRVRYSVLPGVEHNMPDDLDDGQVVDWYLRQTRSHDPVPPDPRDRLGLTSAGFSSWAVVSDPALTGWKSEAIAMADHDAWSHAVQLLFSHVHARGERVDAPIVMQLDPKTNKASLWLAAPKTLHASDPADATTLALPAGRSLRFYFRGPTNDALAHLARVMAEATNAGLRPRNEVWITPLSLWLNTPGYLAEYRIRID